MKHARHLNRFATLAIIPVVAIGIFIAVQARPEVRGAPFEPAGLLVVASLRAESITFLDYDRGTSQEVALAGPPHEMAVAGGSLFVTLGRHNAIAHVDTARREVVRYLVMAGSPHGIAAAGGLLYITLDETDELVVLDAASFAEVDRRPTEDTPHALALAGSTAFVTNARDNTLGAYGAGIELRTTGDLPESVAQLGTALVATANAGDGSVSLFSLPGLDPLGDVALGGRPVRVAAFDDLLLVADARLGRLVVLRAAGASLEVVARLPVGRLADGLCGSPDGRWLAVTANGDNRVAVVDTGSWLVSADFEAADGPGACLWLPGD